MIDTIFQYGSEMVNVRIMDTNVLFMTNETQGGFFPIERIKLDKTGCIKEHPDLKNDKEWKEKTIKRFKEKIKKLETEKQRMKYIIEDLSKHGYKSLYYQEQGFRKIKLK
jgi:hypothetical protein